MKIHSRYFDSMILIFMLLGCWHSSLNSSELITSTQHLTPSNIIPSHDHMLKNKVNLDAFERNIAQRLMISIRYFCEDSSLGEKYCQQPVTELPEKLAKLIEQTDVGGVVLFSENIVSHQQTIKLTNDLQKAASRSKSKSPLFIGIDQEGGRVVRLPREISTAFSGNMAIAATYPRHNDHYAKKVANIIGQELLALGINLNFAPNIDVNSNPDNPVINARSFGEKPAVVSKLGIAMLNAFQQQNIIATLKHFPGHGNTNVDSHTGLPSVDIDKQTLYETDLLPFQNAIELADPGMIMTAHIQYPNLDNSTLVTKSGHSIIKPATMSYKLLTELLRKKMGFNGVIITDAMNMAGISHHFENSQATAISLMAGADIVLMPYRISKEKDIEGFKQFVRTVSNIILQQSNPIDSMMNSINRINKLKKSYHLTEFKQVILDDVLVRKRTENASLILARDSSRNIQNQLALDSITLLKKSEQSLLPSDESSSDLHILVQDSQQLTVVREALNHYWPLVHSKKPRVTHTILSEYDNSKTKHDISQADSVLLFFSARRESAVVKGEIDDLPMNQVSFEKSESERLSNILSSLKFARQQHKKIFIAGMHSPYEMRQFMDVADTVLVAYDANIYEDKQSKKLIGMTYDAVITILLGIQQAKGELPVTL